MSFLVLQEMLKGTHDIAVIEHAFRFAELAHRGQKRKTGEPYIEHPLSIAIRLAELKLDRSTIAAALLHDVVEDSNVPLAEIEKEFGPDIAFLVDGVTKLGKLKYRGTQRMAESLRKMFLAIAEDIRVVLIKLNDRLHNMETLHGLPEEKRRRIAVETLEIYAPLADRLGLGMLKAQLEDLAFPFVYPEEHAWVEKNVKSAYEARAKFIEEITPVVKKEIERDSVCILGMDARAKHKYSLWRKLLKYQMDISQITDLIALRIIVPTVADCYQALGAIHTKWRPLPGKIKDYIALPKPNGYQSLHTTVFGPEGTIVEFQIRTREMHEAAEHGIAAHWAYSQQKDSKEYREKEALFANSKDIKWVSELKDWQKDVNDPKEFLDSLKIDFFKNRIFALTPKGDAVDLPEGATVLDFAYRVHSEIGNSATGARVNGKMAPLDQELSSMDVVEIIRGKRPSPNSDWLGFVKTSLARKHIELKLRRNAQARRFEERQGGLLVEVKIVARDRVGLLHDLTAVVKEFKISLKGSSTERGERAYPLITLNCPVRSNDELRKLVMRLKSVKSVMEVGYKIL